MKKFVLAVNPTRLGAQTILLSLLLCFPDVAVATLGKAEEQIEQDRVAMHLATTRTELIHGYRCTTLFSRDLGLKEYTNPATKVVFGVAWSGSRMPDLLELLGFDPQKIQGKAIYRSLRYTRIQTDSVLVEMGGRMGAYGGRAIRIDLMPRGVQTSEVVP